MRKIDAREFVHMPQEELWTLPDETFELIFSDGTLVTNTRRTIYSAYHWTVFKRYPEMPMLVRHHIGNKLTSVDTTLDLLSNVSETAHLTYGEEGYDREELWKMFYDIVSNIYNVFTVKLAAWQTSTSILDLVELHYHPEIAKANAEVQPTQLSLDKTYAIINDVVRNDSSLNNNQVALAVRGGLVKRDQVNQILGPRGFLTDIDSHLFRSPILSSYLKGITRIHDSLIESRSAAKALKSTTRPLQQVEYFNRKMQLIASYVRDLDMGDCGTDERLTVTIDGPLLKGMEGKYYITEEDPTPKMLRLSDRHLIGKRVKFRSALLCRYRHQQRICACCLGAVAYSIPRQTNLGHVSASEMCQEGSQLVLSVKHYDGSSKVDSMSISEFDAVAIYEGSNPGDVMLQKSISKMEPWFVLGRADKASIAGFTGLDPSVDIRDLSIHRISSFREITLRVKDAKGNIADMAVTVSQGNRHGSFTHEFLEYIIDNGYIIDEETGDYLINLAKWDFDKPVFKLPMRHLNMLDYMAEIEMFIRSPSESNREAKVTGTRKLISYRNPGEALFDLFELASPRLNVNLAHLEVLLVAMMRSAENPDDYRIPPVGKPTMFERHSVLMEKNSLGVGLSFERQPNMMESLDSFLITDRMPHIYDSVVI